jgi:hypothetical protein
LDLLCPTFEELYRSFRTVCCSKNIFFFLL